MNNKPLNGKAIYEPSGKAGEYAKYAVNFYVGCSNDCDYCYCKRGVLGHAMGAPKATLKKCFKNELDAVRTFERELTKNIEEIRKHGLFFTFTSDPMLEDTRKLTMQAVDFATTNCVPCKILTKRADFIEHIPEWWHYGVYRKYIAIGFTLTGRDDLERGASPNEERIAAMKRLHEAGFKTFASIEPIIDLKSSTDMIWNTRGFCDLYKIGLLSGKKEYTSKEVTDFVDDTMLCIDTYNTEHHTDAKIYWKDSVCEYIKASREEMRALYPKIIVESDYNLFQ